MDRFHILQNFLLSIPHITIVHRSFIAHQRAVDER